MSLERETADIIQNLVNRNNKCLAKNNHLFLRFTLLAKKIENLQQLSHQINSEIKEIDSNCKKTQENIEHLKNTMKEYNYDEIKLNNNKVQKKIKKVERLIDSIKDFEIRKEDINISSKKRLKLLLIKASTKLYIDSNPPKNCCRGFTANLENLQLNLFNINLSSDINTTEEVYKKISQTSEYLHEWSQLFQE